MNHPADDTLQSQPVLQPCSEACAAFRGLNPGQWSEFGLCANPHSPRRGYPVRLGRECRFFQVQGPPDPTRAS